jgi:pimeloyl-ACP methyl ester carboxylesterase
MMRPVVSSVAVSVGLALAVGCGTVAGKPRQQPATVTGFLQNGDVRLSYQLDRPAGRGPFPAVVFGHGSGLATKNTCLFMSGRMRERGFATLCYDKRGVGQSTGEYTTVGPGNSERVFPELASDMAVGVAHLRGLPDIDRARVGLMGVSQAGWIIPEAARQSSAAFMIILVGPTVTVGEEIFYSRFTEETATPLAEVYPKLGGFKGKAGFDPRPILERLDVPGLWLLGGQDRSIPTPRTVTILDELIAAGRPFTYRVYPEHGHDLRGAPTWTDIDQWLARGAFLRK